MASRQCDEAFHAPEEKGARAKKDRTNALLRESCEGRFEIAVGSGINNRELSAERARSRLWRLVREAQPVEAFGASRSKMLVESLQSTESRRANEQLHQSWPGKLNAR